MAGDRRVGGVGQADLGQADPAARERVGRSGRSGEKAVEQHRIERLAGQFGLDRAADDLGAAAQDRDRRGGFLGVAEEGFLGGPAGVGRGRLAGRGRATPCPGQVRGHGVGQGEVHVVAAEQDVLADGEAVEGEVAVLLADADQGEVGGAAADVADEDDVADLHSLPPGVAVAASQA